MTDQTPEGFANEIQATPPKEAADLVSARDAKIRAEALAGFTEERTAVAVGSRVPCDCPGDWLHHAQQPGDDSHETHAHFDFVPSVRLVGPWEPDPRTHEQASDEAIHELRRRLAGYKS